MVSATQIFATLREGFRARQREQDLEILWPAMLEKAEENGLPEERAYLAFLIHARLDRAWHHLTEDEIREILDTRKPASRGG